MRGQAAPAESAGSDRLVLILHGYLSGPDRLRHVRATVEQVFPGARVMVPRLPVEAFSSADPNDVVARLLSEVDAAWNASGFEELILIGHSIGGLMARKLYVVACGENQDAALEPVFAGAGTRRWADRVSRIVLLAGMNRGWSIHHHLGLLHLAAWWLLAQVTAPARALGWKPIIFSIRRGAPFIGQLRIQWLSMRRHAREKTVGKALTVQLLGSVDDMVSPEDNVDLVTGGDFVYLDVGRSGHASVIQTDDSPAGRGRAEVLTRALAESAESLQATDILPVDQAPPAANAMVTDVIFVMHGIRDLGHWTQKVARQIKRLGSSKQRVFETETSSYGYFAMLPFLMPASRRSKVEWFMDQYTEALALYPNATFSFVGHSNGSYLIAKALEEYPAVRFKRIVLAGSVIRSGYDWERVMKVGRVESVLNYVASRDWVVAFFPKAFQLLGLGDLGAAGHDGFYQAASERGIYEVRYVRGAHGAALKEQHWPDIARFVVDGTPPPAGDARSRALPIVLVATVAPVVWIVIAAVVTGGGVLLWCASESPSIRTAALMIYAWAVWKVLTRV